MEVNRYIRLTPEKPSKAGWLWTKSPFTTPSWLVEFEFKLHNTLNSGMHGDGFAFWYAQDKEQGGPVFGSKDHFTGLGVFFDTYANTHHRFSFPRINAMIGDGKTSYDVGNDGVTTEIGGCEADFRNKEWPTKARVKYIKDLQFLEISTSLAGNDDWKTCFSLSNVTLPSHGFLGFSAHTGALSDNHDIIKVETKSISLVSITHYLYPITFRSMLIMPFTTAKIFQVRHFVSIHPIKTNKNNLTSQIKRRNNPLSHRHLCFWRIRYHLLCYLGILAYSRRKIIQAILI